MGKTTKPWCATVCTSWHPSKRTLLERNARSMSHEVGNTTFMFPRKRKHLFLIANIVTTSKALVTSSDALVSNSKHCYERASSALSRSPNLNVGPALPIAAETHCCAPLRTAAPLDPSAGRESRSQSGPCPMAGYAKIMGNAGADHPLLMTY